MPTIQNGKVELLYKDRQITRATFPITLAEAVLDSEGYPIAQSYVKRDDVIDTLTSTVKDLPLSAYQGKVLKDLFDNMPTAMTFKGSLGVGGTITALPTASELTKGHTYYVITDGTYAGKSAKYGDLFVCNDTPEWILIPSTSASGTVTNIATTDGIYGGPITTMGTIGLSNSGVVIGTYPKVKVDKFGRVTEGYSLAASDIPNLDTSKITSGTFADDKIASAVTWNGKQNKIVPNASSPTAQLVSLKIDDTVYTVGSTSGTVIRVNTGAGLTGGPITVDGTISLANSGVAAGTYTKLTVDQYGRATAGTLQAASDIPDLPASKITSGQFPDARIASATTWNNKQNQLIAGTGITLTSEGTKVRISAKEYSAEKGISLSSANKFGHSNSVTANTTSGLKFFTHDEYGHVTGSVGKTLGRGVSDLANVIGHSNVVTAQTTADLDAIRFDENGHITSVVAKTLGRGISDVSNVIGHSNTPITAQSVQSLNTIAFDTYGHISAYTPKTLGRGINVQSSVIGHSNSITANTTSGLKFFTYDGYGHISGAVNKTLGRGLSDSSDEIGHSNSVTASTTENIYKFKFDAQGHLTGTPIAVGTDKGIELDTSNNISHINDPVDDGAVSTSGTVLAPGTEIDTTNKNIIFKYDEQGHFKYEPVYKKNYGTITLGTSWTGSAAPYTQTISTPADMFITSADSPILDLDTTSATYALEDMIEWHKVYDAETGGGNITFYALDKTTKSLTVKIKN